MSIRVLVADDSLTARKHVAEALAEDPDLQVVAEAADGREAIALCQALRPDVVTMDMMMPVMSGLAATEYIMAHCPTPILIVSASVNRGELFRTYDALAAGAVDVIGKPTGSEREADWERRLVEAVKLTAKIRVITHPRGRMGRLGRPIVASAPPAEPGVSALRANRAAGGARYRLVVIGASTGGPGAIQAILAGLPASFPLPILVVLHIGDPFAASLAEWLDGLVALPVRIARDGEPLPQAGHGLVLLAPPDRHLVLQGGRLALTEDPPRHSCRPSVDVLFESVAAEHGQAALACLLTGMGKDGAAGLLALRLAGAVTLAQDEATSVVYGMPREAALLGAAERVLPLAGFAPVLGELAALPAIAEGRP